jgi:hypothetical protein
MNKKAKNKRLQMQKPDTHPSKVARLAQTAQPLAKVAIKGMTGATYNLPNKLYTPHEVVEIIDEQTFNVLEFFINWGGGDFTKMLQYRDELQSAVSDVLGYVRRTRGALARHEVNENRKVHHYPFGDDDLASVTGLTLKLIAVISRMEIDRKKVNDLDNLLNIGEAVGLGLGKLLSNEDNGEALRAAAARFTPFPANVAGWIEATRTGRRGTEGREKEVRSWLHSKLLEAWKNCTRPEAYEVVRNWLYDNADQLEGVELWAYEWVNKQEESLKSDPCGTLWRSLDRANAKAEDGEKTN